MRDRIGGAEISSSAMNCINPQGLKDTERILRVQEPVTAEPAEGAENTKRLSGLSVLGGERLSG